LVYWGFFDKSIPHSLLWNTYLYTDLNECPCGYYGDPTRPCTCSSTTVTRYQKRISDPLMDRIDIHMQVPAGGLPEAA
jgi:predicted ATPase with chaperone activity